MLTTQVYLEDLQTLEGLKQLAKTLELETEVPSSVRQSDLRKPVDTHRHNKGADEEPQRKQNSRAHYQKLFRVRSPSYHVTDKLACFLNAYLLREPKNLSRTLLKVRCQFWRESYGYGLQAET